MSVQVLTKKTVQTCEDGRTYLLTYNILSKKYDNIDVFGFEISKYPVRSKSASPIERESALNITDCIDTAQIIFDRLFCHKVTPISLFYVIDDFIGEYL